MRSRRQFCIILAVTCAGEILHAFIPLPIPGSIYGLVLMFVLLAAHVIPLQEVRETAEFLIEIMPVMFIPAAVGLLESWEALQSMLLPVCVITFSVTVIVMGVTGRVAQALIRPGADAQPQNDRKKG